jgi:uncharacterized repeat protein (TIGR02543 family)
VASFAAYNQEYAVSPAVIGDLVTHDTKCQEALSMMKKLAVIAVVSLFALASCNNFALPVIEEAKPDSPQAASRAISLTSPDAFEEDDYQTNAKAIATAGALQEHNFYDDAYDWYSFSAISGHAYVIESFVSGSTDTVLYVMDGSTQKATNDDKTSTNYGSKISFSAPSTKTYTVKCYSYGGKKGSNLGYSFSITDTSAGPTTYTVSYNANGASSGSVPTDSATYAAGATVTAKTNSGGLAKTGYTFDGWNTNASGTGTSYAAGATFAMGSANVILYAKWTASQSTAYTVSYNGNGASSGSVPIDTGTYATGAAVTVKSNTGNLAKPGYAFGGWNRAADGSGSGYVAGATFTMGSANVVLYAVWTPTGSGGFAENFSLPQSVRDYYRSAYGLSGSALKTALKNIISSTHSPKSYDALWTMFYTSDKAPNGKVWDMYSATNAEGTAAAYWYTLGSDQAGTYNSEADVYNREHTWPQSNFGEWSTAKGDGHHVTPTDGYVNGRRSNYAYGEVGSATWTSMNGSKLGSARSGLGFTGTVFEPVGFYKGDHARMHFYMALRYYGDSHFLSCDWANAGAKLKPWYDTMLRAWAASDAVSAKEIARNNAIQAHQGNRNPFIDYPELISMIDLTN